MIQETLTQRTYLLDLLYQIIEYLSSMSPNHRQLNNPLHFVRKSHHKSTSTFIFLSVIESLVASRSRWGCFRRKRKSPTRAMLLSGYESLNKREDRIYFTGYCQSILGSCFHQAFQALTGKHQTATTSPPVKRMSMTIAKRACPPLCG